ncbi:MAG: nucleotidyltransferase family protein [Anaerolineae bacterium]|nr:nucleotidyltransferase family protein [Anaerolineae bacterium]
MNDQANFTRPDSDLHALGALVAGNLAPDAVPADQWPAITALALQHGLAPMLHWTLKQAGCDLDANPAWQPLIRARYQTAIDWALKERAQLEIDAALRAAGIPAIWLKGSVLARTVYPEPSLRPMSDLDVLVPYEQREAALKVVQAAGYDFYIRDEGIRAVDSRLLSFSPTAHHYCLRGGVGDAVKIELHFRVIGSEEVLSLGKLQWFTQHQQSIILADGTSLCTLSPEAHLVYLAAHAVLQHGEEHLRLLRYFDLHRCIIQLPPDWNAALDLAVAMEWTLALERALRHAVEYFATPVPAEVFEALISRRPAQENTRRVTHRHGLVYHSRRFYKKFAYLPLPERLRFFFRIFFPTSTFMRRRFAIPPGKSVWPYYFVRWYNRGRIWASAVWARGEK